jgi:hypothetical protein
VISIVFLQAAISFGVEVILESAWQCSANRRHRSVMLGKRSVTGLYQQRCARGLMPIKPAAWAAARLPPIAATLSVAVLAAPL